MKKVLSVLCMAVLAGGLIFTSCTKKQYTITVKANNDDWGTVTGGGTFDDGATISLTATPNDGYRFVKWQDGSTDNPLSITVTADETWTAYFEEIPAPPAQPGVKVTFNTDNYDAGAYNGVYSSSYNAWQVTAAKINGEYPYADVAMYTGTATGQHTDQATDNGQFSQESDFGWVEYYLEGYVYFEDSPNTHYGDWWAKNATVNVTAFDATALNMSANVNATMFDVIGAFGQGGAGLDGAATAPMTVNMTAISLQNSGKGFTPKKIRSGKLVAAK